MNKLYDEDFFGWTQAQADALRRRSANELDWDNLLEEIAGLGKATERELRNRLVILLTHLLKWTLQPTRRSRSWTLTVREQRRQIDRLLEENPSLRPKLDDVLVDAYATAVNAAPIRPACRTRPSLRLRRTISTRPCPSRWSGSRAELNSRGSSRAPTWS